MNFSININAIIPGLAVLQALIFIPLLVLRGNAEERNSDRWLAFLLGLLAVSVTPFMLGWLGITYLWEELPMLPWDGFDLLIPATIYYFLCSSLNPNFRLNWRKPYGYVLYLVYFFYHLAIGLQHKAWVIHFWHSIDNKINMGFNLINLAAQVYYLYQSFYLYNQYQKALPTIYSDLETVGFSWFRNFLYVFSVVVLIQGIYTVSSLFLDYDYSGMWWIYAATTFYTFYLSIAGYAQPRTRASIVFENGNFTAIIPESTSFLPENRVELQPNLSDEDGEEASISFMLEATDSATTQKTGLTPQELHYWKTRLERLMTEQQLYLEPELTLSDLATRLKTNISIVSAVVNTAFGKNFNDYINEQRVQIFQARAKDPKLAHLTLLGIALDCGFNSKTTFNRAFKKHTGTSPTEWRREA